MTWQWPLRASPLLPDLAGLYGFPRTHDVHTGIDLYCEIGTDVLAVEDGEVISVSWFTGQHVLTEDGEPSSWWNDTHVILVKGASGVVAYGEVAPRVAVGDQVTRGQTIAVVETSVLRSVKGRPMVMLHLELLSPDATDTCWWNVGQPEPFTLRNPLPHLLVPGVDVFDLRTYDGIRFRDPNAPVKPSRWSEPQTLIDWGVPVQEAAVAIVRDGSNRVLLLHRGPQDRATTGKCLPGGKLDAGESPEEAVIREVLEETHLHVHVRRALPIVDSLIQGVVYRIHPFEVYVEGGKLRQFPSPEHEGCSWLDLATLEQSLTEFSGLATISILRLACQGVPG